MSENPLLDQALWLLSLPEQAAQGYGHHVRGRISVGPAKQQQQPMPSASNHSRCVAAPGQRQTTAKTSEADVGRTLTEAMVFARRAVQRVAQGAGPCRLFRQPEENNRQEAAPPNPLSFVEALTDCQHDLLPALTLFNRIARGPTGPQPHPESELSPPTSLPAPTACFQPAPPAGPTIDRNNSSQHALTPPPLPTSSCASTPAPHGLTDAPAALEQPAAGAAAVSPPLLMMHAADRQAASCGVAACHVLLSLSHSDPRDALSSASDALRCVLLVLPALAASAAAAAAAAAAATAPHSDHNDGGAVVAAAGAGDDGGYSASGSGAATPAVPPAQSAPHSAAPRVRLPPALAAAGPAGRTGQTSAAADALAFGGRRSPSSSAAQAAGSAAADQEDAATAAAATAASAAAAAAECVLRLLEAWLEGLLGCVVRAASLPACRREIAGVLPQLQEAHMQLRAQLLKLQQQQQQRGQQGQQRGQFGPPPSVMDVTSGLGLQGRSGSRGEERGGGGGGGGGDGGSGLAVCRQTFGRLAQVLEQVSAAIQQGLVPFGTGAAAGSSPRQRQQTPGSPSRRAQGYHEAAHPLLATALEAARLFTVHELLRSGAGSATATTTTFSSSSCSSNPSGLRGPSPPPSPPPAQEGPLPDAPRGVGAEGLRQEAQHAAEWPGRPAITAGLPCWEVRASGDRARTPPASTIDGAGSVISGGAGSSLERMLVSSTHDDTHDSSCATQDGSSSSSSSGRTSGILSVSSVKSNHSYSAEESTGGRGSGSGASDPPTGRPKKKKTAVDGPQAPAGLQRPSSGVVSVAGLTTESRNGGGGFERSVSRGASAATGITSAPVALSWQAAAAAAAAAGARRLSSVSPVVVGVGSVFTGCGVQASAAVGGLHGVAGLGPRGLRESRGAAAFLAAAATAAECEAPPAASKATRALQ